ncbi:hypothetical protein SH601_03790 [Gracilibacillus sp. S3-1-1]|uniref:Uncharacterized protein n=1 Tax=Gracilibacillus pellucidus TaxID=3095368 RepID=A0ACC6M2C4_9BACI|nr:hypothetical protein [Gracilibacillus sp. S3-1-1]MDX8045100.1 hypothetical protein [Gracilibacillus sp. S3-1-1]
MNKNQFLLTKEEISYVNSWLTKLIGASFEFYLGIPFVGGAFIVSFFWLPLIAMLAYHIITLTLSQNNHATIWSPVIGIIASILGFIPFLGMVLHWIAFICLLIDGITNLVIKDRK